MRDKKACAEYLSTLPLFRGLPFETIIEMLSDEGCILQSFNSREILLEAGEKAHWLGVLLLGEANVYKESEGIKMLMSVLKQGSLLGAATMFMQDAKAATRICARKKCLLLRFDEKLFEKAMRDNFSLTRNYLEYLTTRVHFLTRRIEEIACPCADDRLMNFLIQNAEDKTLTLPLGMNALAETLCMSRASLYRVMNGLIEEGKIKRDGKTIYIL